MGRKLNVPATRSRIHAQPIGSTKARVLADTQSFAAKPVLFPSERKIRNREQAGIQRLVGREASPMGRRCLRIRFGIVPSFSWLVYLDQAIHATGWPDLTKKMEKVSG